MTTVAFRDGTMAADGRETVGSRIDRDNCKKVFRLSDGSVAGFAGSTMVIEPFIEALEAVLKKYKAKKSEKTLPVGIKGISALVAYDNQLLYYEKGRWMDAGVPYYSIGSGSSYALAAMDLGASAVEAVKIAAGRDIHSGGKIRSYSV